MILSPDMQLLSRLLSQGEVDSQTHCLLWTGLIMKGHNAGYGICPKTKYGRRVHRVVYKLIYGEIPDELDIDHLCRVRRCLNPFHLEAVTHRVNVLRGIAPAAVNAFSTNCPLGHPYTGINIRGDRFCHTCYAESARRSRWRKSGRPTLGPRAERTTCPHGHTYSGVDYRGARFCQTCRNMTARDRRSRRKAK